MDGVLWISGHADYTVRLDKGPTWCGRPVQVCGDNKTCKIALIAPKESGDVDLSALEWGVSWQAPSGMSAYSPVEMIDANDGMVWLEWTVGSAVTAECGWVHYTVEAAQPDGGECVWKSAQRAIEVLPAVHATDIEIDPDTRSGARLIAEAVDMALAEAKASGEFDGPPGPPGPPGTSGDYAGLDNKPSIEGRVLDGDKTFIDLGLEALTEQDIDDIIFGGD